MLQCLRQRRLLDIGARPGSERSARRGDDNANQFFAIAGTERLEQRVMFGVGRQDAGPGVCRALHEKIARAYKALLVGKRDGGAAIDGCKRGLQPGRAADGGHDPIRRAGSGFDNRAFAGAAFGARTGQRILQFSEAIGIGNGCKARAELLCELRQPLHVGIRRQRLDPIALARCPQQIHRAVADRAGRTQHGYGTNGRSRGFVVTQRDCAHDLTKPQDRGRRHPRRPAKTRKSPPLRWRRRSRPADQAIRHVLE